LDWLPFVLQLVEALDQKPTSPRKPFVFRITKEKLEDCRGMSPEAKLQWLEEANRFIYKFVSRDQLARWQKLRQSETERNIA
jgi:hypothetical protein